MKLVLTLAALLALLNPQPALGEGSNHDPMRTPVDTTSWWTNGPLEAGDSCREACAEDGASPEECQMDCNALI